MDVVFNKKKIVSTLVFFALGLIVIHVILLGLYYYIDDPKKFAFVKVFNLGMEKNIPTIFSSLILAISALCFYVLSKVPEEIKDKKNKYWLGLSFVFLFLSFDETAKLHERLGDLIAKFIDNDGYIYYPWVIGYGIFVLILGFFYMKFFWNMEKKIFRSFMLSAFIYLSGAVVLEMIGSNEASQHGSKSGLYRILYTFEESLEMFGVIYLIWILLTLLENRRVVIKA